MYYICIKLQGIMIAVITGDIVNSREINSKIWMNLLKNCFLKQGKEPKTWQIYRGDSFQLKVAAEDALDVVFEIKTVVKTIQDLDVRLAVGIGEMDYNAKKITESNGTAFVNSGECFENLKKQTLAIQSNSENFDSIFNAILHLVNFTANNWTVKTAEIIKIALENPNVNQMELAEMLNRKNQSTISAALKRGAYDELKTVLNLYKIEVQKL